MAPRSEQVEWVTKKPEAIENHSFDPDACIDLFEGMSAQATVDDRHPPDSINDSCNQAKMWIILDLYR